MHINRHAHSVRLPSPGEKVKEESGDEPTALDFLPVGACNNVDEKDGLGTGRTVRSVHLVSLPPLVESLPKSVRDIWKWKDFALGDGRDYFIPRPRALGALNSIVISGSKGDFIVEECGVLSNCARLDIVLIAKYRRYEDGLLPEKEATRVVAEALAAQLQKYRQAGLKKNPALEGMGSFFDMPGVVDVEAPAAEAVLVEEVQNHLTHVGGEDGVERVSRHMSLVAAGVAPRPSRPGRPVAFRPFSSRDAHIMLQLKRTAEVAMGSRVRVIFDSALQAGKAARDPDSVPEIRSLRSYGAEGKYGTEAPPELIARATKAMKELAIETAVDKCISKFMAIDASDAVSQLRLSIQNVLLGEGIDINSDTDVGRCVRSMLHQPCIDLREGRQVDINTLLEMIQAKLRNKIFDSITKQTQD